MIRDGFILLKETANEWLDDNASSRAAAVAYYTLISMAPLLLIVVAVSGFIFGEKAASGELFNQLKGMIGAESAKVIQSTIENARENMKAGVIASIINVGVLIFGATGVFAELQDALNQMWSVAPRKAEKTKTTIINYLRKRVLSFAMVLVIAFLLLVSLVISAVLATLTGALNNVVPGFNWFWQPVNFAISFCAVTVLFAMMYKVLPDAKVRWRDTIIGAAITSLLFSVGKLGIGLYLGNAGFSSTYGAAGAVVVTVVWVYYSAQILFFGAEFTQVYARHKGVAIQPDAHAVQIEVVRKEHAQGDAVVDPKGVTKEPDTAEKAKKIPTQELH